MVMVQNDFFIPVPRARNTKVQVLVNGTDMTSYVYDSSFILPVTVGIGTFNITLSNSSGRFSGQFSEGNEVYFYADYINGTFLQFKGRIDFVKEILGSGGQYLGIEGRHVSWNITEIKVNYTATGADPANILIAIIGLFAPGFSTAGIQLTGKTYDVSWNYAPFWECVKELCTAGSSDCYVDNNLVFHYFAQNSIFNGREYIAENDNYISTDDWGTDTLFEKTRVVVTSTDSEGMPIVYTAKNGVDNSSTEATVREVHIDDSTISSYDEAKALAVATLNTNLLTAPPQGTITSLGLQNALPGDNFWVAVMRQQIYGCFKVISLTHRFGVKVGGWRTQTRFEREERGIQQAVELIFHNASLQTVADNPNKHPYSFNFGYDNDNLTLSNSDTQVSNGALRLAGSAANGTWISTSRTAPANITSVELRFSGSSLDFCTFWFSVNGGQSWEQFTGQQILQTPAGTGSSLAFKVVLTRDATSNPAPQLDSAVVLYSA